MKPARLLVALIVLSGAIGSARVADKDYALNWRPKQGDVASYKLSFSATLPPGPLQFDTELIRRVTKLETTGGFTVESAFTNGKSTIEHAQQPILDEKSTETYSPKGERLASPTDAADDQFTLMLSYLTDKLNPGHPVKVGEKWSAEALPDPVKKVAAAKVDYEATGLEQVGSYEAIKIKVAFKEKDRTPPTMYSGFVWVSTADASLVGIQVSIDNLRFDSITASGAKLTLTRT